jgi:WD40 repeat protein
VIANPSDNVQLLNATNLSDVIGIRFVQRHFSFNFDGSVLWHAGNGMFELDRDTIDRQLAVNQKAQSADARFDASFSQVIDGGHILVVWSVDVSPNGQLLATSAYDGMVKIWACESGALLKTLPLHNHPVWRVAFSTDGRILATGNEPVEDEVSEVILWDTANWKELRRIPASTRMVSGLAFHPQRPWLAMGMTDGVLKIVDVNTGEIVHRLNQSGGSVMDVVFSPDGERLAAACIQDGLKVFDVSDEGASNEPIVPQTISQFGQHVWTVDWSNDGASLVSGDHLGVVDFYEAESLSLKLKLPTGSTRLRYLRFGKGDRLLGGSAYVGTGFVLDLERFQDSLAAMQME